MNEAATFGPSDLGIKSGDHVCALYWGVASRDEIILPFLRAGLLAGDHCICVAYATDPSAVLDRIDNGIDVDAAVASRQLAVRAATDTYLKGGYFSTNEMLDFYEGFVRPATEGGNVARVLGEGAWAAEGWPGAEELMDYESEINRFVTRYPQMILCLYDLELCGGGMVVDLLTTHPKILLGGMLIDNPNYMTPDEFRKARAAGA